jgi:hypothetical protein
MMDTYTKRSLLSIAVGLVVGLATGVGMLAWLRMDPSGQRGNGLPNAFDYDLSQYQKIDPALVHYMQKTEIAVGMRQPRAVAVGPDDRIFVAGDKAVRQFSPEGKPLATIGLDQEPNCLAVGQAVHKAPGRIYVGMRDHVETFDTAGKRQAVWDRPGKRTVLTSIAVAEEDVFAADAGDLVVWHYDANGKLLGAIGKRDESRGIPGFIVPSAYFDVAIAPDGLLRAVNPGMHRIEAFTFDGHLELSWGVRGMSVEAFCGCCNPSHIAILPDGRMVTAEKGIPRVKVYSESGQFECVVVGPDVLAPNPSATVETRDELRLHPVSLAVDSHSRILVLDPTAGAIRVFVHK